MSGYSERDAMGENTLEPGTEFIAKPFSAADLNAKLAALLGDATPWPDEPIEDRHAAAVGDADVAVVGLRPADPDPFAVLAEQPADVGQEVREEVARIAVHRDPARGQARGEDVVDTTSVGVDQPAEEPLGMLIDHRALPIGEHDRPVVLQARSVLREYLGQQLR
jgi:hypothetical protein